MDLTNSTTNYTDHERGKHLTFEDRLTIKIFKKLGYSIRAIASNLNCSPSTVMYSSVEELASAMVIVVAIQNTLQNEGRITTLAIVQGVINLQRYVLIILSSFGLSRKYEQRSGHLLRTGGFLAAALTRGAQTSQQELNMVTGKSIL